MISYCQKVIRVKPPVDNFILPGLFAFRMILFLNRNLGKGGSYEKTSH